MNLQELRETMWYRLLKVIWGGSLLLLLAVASIVIAEENQEKIIVDREETEVLCVRYGPLAPGMGPGRVCPFNTNNPGHLDPEDQVISRRSLGLTSVYLSVEDTLKGCPDKQTWDNLQAVCGRIDLDELFAEDSKRAEPRFDPQAAGQVMVVPAIRRVGGWREIAVWTLTAWLAIYAFFEVVRRVVYYVLLGSWRPKLNVS